MNSLFLRAHNLNQMKEFLCFLIVVLSTLTLHAQVDSANAIGIRIGENDGFRNEITYQVQVSDMNRVEANLGYRSNPDYEVSKATALFQWVWFIEEDFNWYAGFGSSIGNWNSKTETYTDNDGLFVKADVNIGLEYIFKGPWMLSLDLRPEFVVVGNFGDNPDFDLGLAVRYLF